MYYQCYRCYYLHIVTAVTLVLFFSLLQPALLSLLMEQETPPKFSQLLREGNRFTDRDFMKALGIGHRALKQREADPSQFTLDEILLLAEMLKKPAISIATIIIDEMKRNPTVTEKVAVTMEQVKGRKLFPRTPKS